MLGHCRGNVWEKALENVQGRVFRKMFGRLLRAVAQRVAGGKLGLLRRLLGRLVRRVFGGMIRTGERLGECAGQRSEDNPGNLLSFLDSARGKTRENVRIGGMFRGMLCGMFRKVFG